MNSWIYGNRASRALMALHAARCCVDAEDRGAESCPFDAYAARTFLRDLNTAHAATSKEA